MKILLSLILFAAMALTGCGTTHLQYNGRLVTGKIVAEKNVTIDEALEREMKQDGVITMTEIKALKTKPKKATDFTKLGHGIGLSLHAVAWGLAGVESAWKGVSITETLTSGTGFPVAGTGIMAFTAVTDLMMAAHDWQLRKNSAYVRLKLNKPVEVEKARNGVSDNFVFAFIDKKDLEKGLERIDQCRWLVDILPLVKRDNAVLYCPQIEKENLIRRNYSFVSRDFLFMIRYNEEDAARPEKDPCNFKEAEALLKTWVVPIADDGTGGT